MDPDPHGSTFTFPPGSGPAYNMWMRYGSRRKTFRKNRKKARKLVIIGILLPFIFNVNLDQLHDFYTFELFGCLFQLQKTFFLSFSNCLLVFFNKICTYCLLIIHMGSKKKSYCRRAAMFSYLDSPSFLLGGLRPLGKLFIRYFHKFV